MLLHRRKFSVIVGLALLGALSGALVASGMFVAVVVARLGLVWSEILMAVRVGSAIGAPLGALVAPALGLNRFRRIPIGRAIVAVTIWPLAAAALGAMIEARWAVPFALIGLLVGPYWATRRR